MDEEEDKEVDEEEGEEVDEEEVTKYDVYVCSLLLLHIIFLRAAQYCQNGRELVRAVFFKEKHFPALENRLHLDSAPVKEAQL